MKSSETFESAMEKFGVTQLDQAAKIEHNKLKPLPNNENAVAEEQSVLRESMAEFPDLSKVEIDGNEEFRKPGLAKRDFIRLKQGKFHRQDSAHVRGYTVEESAKIVRRFLADSVNSGFRCVKIVHGKGLNSPDGISRVKLTTQKILTLNKFVLGYCNALPNDGGSGAKYILLKKRQG